MKLLSHVPLFMTHDCVTLLGCSVHGILQVNIEWIAISLLQVDSFPSQESTRLPLEADVLTSEPAQESPEYKGERKEQGKGMERG